MAELKIRPAAEARWDCVSFGEVMLRFDPGFGRVRNARSFTGLGRRRRIQRRPRHAQVLGQARRRRDRAAEERPRLAGRGLHHAGRRRHCRTSIWRDFDGLGRNTRVGLNFTEKGFGIRAGARLFGPRPLRGVADQARRSELGEALRRGRRALVPHRRHLRGAGVEHVRGGHRSGRGRQEIRHRRRLRPQLPRLAVEEPGRQGRRAEGQPRRSPSTST